MHSDKANTVLAVVRRRHTHLGPRRSSLARQRLERAELIGTDRPGSGGLEAEIGGPVRLKAAVLGRVVRVRQRFGRTEADSPRLT